MPGKRRLSKTDPIFDCLGALDETNAFLALLSSRWPKSSNSSIIAWTKLKADLLLIGSWIASRDKSAIKLDILTKRVANMEKVIDEWEKDLPPLNNFLLPPDTEVAAISHLARSVSRRAERAYHRLNRKSTEISRYLNRLSDYLFICARAATSLAGRQEEIWQIN